MKATHSDNQQKENPMRISLSLKDQKSADVVRLQVRHLRNKISKENQPVFICRKVNDRTSQNHQL